MKMQPTRPKSYLEHVREEFHRDRTPEERALFDNFMSKLNWVAMETAPTVLSFCEGVIVVSLLLAATSVAKGLDAFLVWALVVVLGFACWMRFQAIWPAEPYPLKNSDNWKPRAMLRGFLSLAVSAVLMFVAWRLSEVLLDLQFGAKNPEPPPAASTTYTPPLPANFQPPAEPKPLPPKPKPVTAATD